MHVVMFVVVMMPMVFMRCLCEGRISQQHSHPGDQNHDDVDSLHSAVSSHGKPQRVSHIVADAAVASVLDRMK
jgi:hypothetical protein